MQDRVANRMAPAIRCATFIVVGREIAGPGNSAVIEKR